MMIPIEKQEELAEALGWRLFEYPAGPIMSMGDRVVDCAYWSEKEEPYILQRAEQELHKRGLLGNYVDKLLASVKSPLFGWERKGAAKALTASPEEKVAVMLEVLKGAKEGG